MQNYYSERFKNNRTCLEMRNVLSMARCICAAVDSPRVLWANWIWPSSDLKALARANTGYLSLDMVTWLADHSWLTAGQAGVWLPWAQVYQISGTAKQKPCERQAASL